MQACGDYRRVEGMKHRIKWSFSFPVSAQPDSWHIRARLMLIVLAGAKRRKPMGEENDTDRKLEILAVLRQVSLGVLGANIIHFNWLLVGGTFV